MIWDHLASTVNTIYSLVQGFIPAKVSLVAAVPLILHLADKLFDRLHLLGHDLIHRKLKGDLREPVRTSMSNEAVFKGVKTYFDFDRDTHFIFSLTFFSMVSLYFAQVECTHAFTRLLFVPTLAIFALLVFGFGFVAAIARERFQMDAVDPTRNWRRSGYAAFVATLVLEVYMRQTCPETD
jgi:hypothetical protein